MENNTYKYGTCVYVPCQEKIGTIKSISQTDSVHICFEDGSIINIKKNKLKIIPHKKKDLIKYENTYYIIYKITAYRGSCYYHIGMVNFIRTENDYSTEKMRANGEEAEILDFDGSKVTIQYSGIEDKPEEITIDELYENFILNYCVTVHKSQGSQYENVVFFIEPKNTFIDKKLIYTAISRAKTRCFVISSSVDFINLQNNNKKNDKVSLFMIESDKYDL